MEERMTAREETSGERQSIDPDSLCQQLRDAVENGEFDALQKLLQETEVDVIVESSENQSLLDIARCIDEKIPSNDSRKIDSQKIIDLLVARIIDNSFQVLEESSNLNKPDRPSSDTVSMEKVHKKIKQTEDKIKSCLEFLEKINKDERSDDQKDNSYEQANILIYFIETFALDGATNTEIKNGLKNHFSQYYTEQDRTVFSTARKRLLHVSANKKLTSKDIITLICGNTEKIFDKLVEYVQYVQYVQKLRDSIKTTISELRGQGTGENDDQILQKKMVEKVMNDPQIKVKIRKSKKEETQDQVEEFQEQWNREFNRSSDEVVKSFFIELQKFVQSKREGSLFFETSNDETREIGEKMDVESYVKEEFEILMDTSYTEGKNITPELLFNFVVNISPAFDHIKSKGKNGDLVELRWLRSNLIHEFHKFGPIAFRKEISKLRHTLFIYYFAQQVKQVLASKFAENPKIIDAEFKKILETFKVKYKNAMEKEYVISTEEAKDLFGYKFSKILFPERGDCSEALVDEYLRFMLIIDCEEDSPIDNEQGRSRKSRKKLEAHSRREIFEEFCRLKRIREHDSENGDYEAEKVKLENKLFEKYDVPRHHFRKICSLHLESESNHSDHRTRSKNISGIIKLLNQIKDGAKLSNRYVISLYDKYLNDKDLFSSEKNRLLLKKNGVQYPDDLITKFNRLPPDEMMNMSIGEETLSINRGKVISNMLKTFYDAYDKYTIQFVIEEIFNDKTFLDHLVAKEIEVPKPEVEDLVDLYLKLTNMFFGQDTKMNGEARKKIFEEFYSLKELHKHCQNVASYRENYETQKEKFRKLVLHDGIQQQQQQQDFDNSYEYCMDDDKPTDEKSSVLQVKKLINDLKSIFKPYEKVTNKMIASLFKKAIEGKVCPEEVGCVLQMDGTKPEEIANILKNLSQPGETAVSIQLGDEKWSGDTRKVTCDMLEAFDYKDMIIEKLLNVADYTAPYIVRLITKAKSDVNIGKDDLVRLVEILLMKKESFYIESLNELLQLGSSKPYLYEENCNKIVKPSFYIRSIRPIFKKKPHVKRILEVLIGRVKSHDQSKDKMIELSKKVIKILVYDIFAFGFSEYEEKLAIFRQLLQLIKVIKSTSVYPNGGAPTGGSRRNDLMVRFEYDIKLKMTKVTNYQGQKSNKEEATSKYEETLEMLAAMEIPDDVYPQSLLASCRKASTLSLLERYEEAFVEWECLYKKIVKLVYETDVLSQPDLDTTGMYAEIEGSKKYKEILDESVEYNKHLNILRIRNWMAQNRLSEGCLHNKVEHCKKALDIYKEVYSYQKCSLGPKHKNTASTGSFIARTHSKIAKVMSEQNLNRDALKHGEFALLRNVRFAKMRKDMYGTYHPASDRTMLYIVYNLHHIASLNEKLGDAEARGSKENEEKKTFYQTALTLFNKIHDYRKVHDGESYKLYISDYLYHIAYLNEQLGDAEARGSEENEEKKIFYQEALTSYEKISNHLTHFPEMVCKYRIRRISRARKRLPGKIAKCNQGCN